MQQENEWQVRLRKRTNRLLIDGRLLLSLGDRSAQLQPFDPLRRTVFERLCAGTSRDHIGVELAGSFGNDAGAVARQVFDHLNAAGLLEHTSKPHRLDPEDLHRFDRQLNYLSQWETPARSRFDLLSALRESTVTVVGTGGLGSWLIYSLLCSGVGRLKLIDGDRVEFSNLNRSILYDEREIDRPKVEAARDSVLRFAPRTTVETHAFAVTAASDLAGVIKGDDLVIATADQPAWLIRQWVAEACHDMGVPLLHPSGLRVGPFFLPGDDSSCPMCEWAHLVDRNPRQAEVLETQRSLPAGDPGPVSYIGTITAGVAGMEAFGFLSGIAPPVSVNGIWQMNQDLGAQVVSLRRHPGCGVCGGRSSRYRLGTT